MDLCRLQKILDADKWYASERALKDICGELPFCVKCEKAAMYPCAVAYQKFYAKEAKNSRKKVKK